MYGHDFTWITKVENRNVHDVLEQTILCSIIVVDRNEIGRVTIVIVLIVYTEMIRKLLY